MGNQKSVKITEYIRNVMLSIFIFTFVSTAIAISIIEKNIAENQADDLLALTVADVTDDILDISDKKMVSLAEYIATDFDNLYVSVETDAMTQMFDNAKIIQTDPVNRLLLYLQQYYNVTEINIINEDGIIQYSTNRAFVGFDFHSGKQSSEFLPILDGLEYYVQSYQPITYDQSIGRKYCGYDIENGGFIQVGYDYDQFQAQITKSIHGITKHRHVGSTGYVTILSVDGTIVSSPDEEAMGKKCTDYNISLETIESKMTGIPYFGKLLGEEFDCLGKEVEGYYIFALLPRVETLSSLRQTVFASYLFETIAFIVLFFIIFTAIKKRVVDNISSVASSLEKIAGGNLDVTVDVKGTAEFESLSESINTTVNSLRENVEREVERINADLEYAKNIQRSALPLLFPPFPDRNDFDIYASMDAAKEVGGDLFDFELLNPNELGFCIADVSGKGIPAALFMMKAKTLINSYGVAGLRSNEILSKVNDELCDNNVTGMFVTCWLGILNLETGTIEYSNGGHNPPLVRHGNGQFEYLKDAHPGFVLGGMSGMNYTRREISLAHGDEIFLYTDGITEAINEKEELFGEGRLKAVLDSIIDDNCEKKCVKVKQKIDEFAGAAPQFDDITMLSIKYFGSANTITAHATTDNYSTFMNFIDRKLEENMCDEINKARIDVACDELISNVIKYAYGDALGTLTIHVDSTAPRGIAITFIDNGTPFNPAKAPVPDTTLPASERKIGSLGIHIVKKTMDKVEYKYSNGNRLKITKYF